MTLVLPADLTVGEVGNWCAILLEALDGQEALTLDGNAIEAIDGAGIQLLAAFARTAAERQCSWRWVRASVPLCEAARQLGLASLLGLEGGQAAAADN